MVSTATTKTTRTFIDRVCGLGLLLATGTVRQCCRPMKIVLRFFSCRRLSACTLRIVFGVCLSPQKCSEADMTSHRIFQTCISQFFRRIHSRTEALGLFISHFQMLCIFRIQDLFLPSLIDDGSCLH